MMNFDGSDVKSEFEAAFGREINTLTQAQLWWLVKFGKHIRGRCRNNAAMNNYLSRNFKHASFRQVEKETNDGRTYDGLEITIK